MKTEQVTIRGSEEEEEEKDIKHRAAAVSKYERDNGRERHGVLELLPLQEKNHQCYRTTMLPDSDISRQEISEKNR